MKYKNRLNFHLKIPKRNTLLHLNVSNIWQLPDEIVSENPEWIKYKTRRQWIESKRQGVKGIMESIWNTCVWHSFNWNIANTFPVGLKGIFLLFLACMRCLSIDFNPHFLTPPSAQYLVCCNHAVSIRCIRTLSVLWIWFCNVSLHAFDGIYSLWVCVCVCASIYKRW